MTDLLASMCDIYLGVYKLRFEYFFIQFS